MIRAAILGIGLLCQAGLLLQGAPAWAEGEKIVSGLSQYRVAITANFDGSEIMIYGAVKRDAPPPKGPPLEVIITVEGPAAPLVIRRKERVAGIWLNATSVTVQAAPSFYAVATSGQMDKVLSVTDDLRHKISLKNTIRAIGRATEADTPTDFLAALERIRGEDGSYRLMQGKVQLVDETLFRADIALPANLTEGNYKVRMFITRGGRVIDIKERLIGVRKAGLERTLYIMAHDQPLLYGLISLALAAIAGWAASAGFRLLRR